MIYIATTPPNASAAHPSFKQRSITNLTAVQPNTISILGVPHSKELAYSGYRDNIDIFIAATNRFTRLRTDIPGALLLFTQIGLSIHLPPIDYIPSQKLSNDQADALCHKLKDMEPSKMVIGKTLHIILNRPKYELAMRLIQSSIENVVPAPDRLTPRDLLAVGLLRQIITEFLATQTYPAWRNNTDRREDKDILEQMDFQLFIQKVSKVTLHEPSKKKARIESDQDDDDESQNDMQAEDIEERQDITWDTLRESVIVAKPSPIPYSFNVGGPAEVPNLPGLAFPYFDRMLIPDAQTLRNIVSTFFLRCLGDTRDEQRQMFRTIRSSLEAIPRHRFGAELVHIFLGIKLAIETQTRLFLVYVSADYAGFCLLGAQFSVLIDNVWSEAQSPEELKKDIAKMSSHTHAVSRLSDLLSDCTLKDDTGKSSGTIEKLDPDMFRTGHDLWKAVQSRIIPSETHDEIYENIRLVSFSRSYKEINPANIRWAIDMVTTKANEPIPEDVPLHVPCAITQMDDRVLKVLCCFGPDSFSFVNMSGSSFALTPSSRSKDPNEELDEGGKRKILPVVIVAVKGVLTAASDLRKVMKDKKITMDLRERAQRNRCIVFKGQQRDLVYSKLRELADFDAKASKDDSGKGKGRDTGHGSAPTTADALLSLF
jgi:hypothetical protein